MALSDSLSKRIVHAVTDLTLGKELIDAVNLGVAGAQQETWSTAMLIVGTSTSTTTDFGGLVVGDKILIVPAVAGNAQFVTCATAGTLPQAGVVGSLYVVLRAFAGPAASTVKL